MLRPSVRGKFLAAGDSKLELRGVTYGTFAPGLDNVPYPEPAVVDRDFAQMAELGFTCLRTYTVPPRWLLDLARAYGLYVLVGLAWEEHIAFLEDPARARGIEAQLRRQVASCAGHPSILAYAIGNEIPSAVVRWHGPRRVERYLERLYEAATAEDPDALITYISYPSTEYLDLPFLDFVAFNVYLEREPDLVAYLARLQNIAGGRPLVLAEVGLDSRRHGQIGQAVSLDWQVRAASAAGCAGVFLFAWTDEWHRGGQAIEDWDFGLTQRDRRPKPALAAVRRAFAEGPFPAGETWPRVSVVVCSYNGARVIGDCLAGLREQTYSNYEVIVVDDGSTDATAAIADASGVRVISTPNHGLSSARNVGLAAATGEIVAYTDDDARPDPDWLLHLAAAFRRSDYAGIGGPNIAPPGDGSVAECVANAPGGPVHVLLTDTEAEHIPGCNMAFRKDCLEAIGGFDPQFRTAGDDVDVCWRLQERGWKLGFSPAAMVWHHRRNSVNAYWKQQVGYGKAEALLERKWPQKYNAIGHLAWMGRLYARGLTRTLGLSARRIYHGVWGSAPFQSLYQPAPSMVESLPLMPEWYLVTAALAVLFLLGVIWTPLLASGVLLIVAIGAPIAQAARSAARASFPSPARSTRERAQRRGLTALLHLLQPLARLTGRLENGLSPWRSRGAVSPAMPRTRGATLWTEHWQDPVAWLQALETALADTGARVRRGPAWANWDLEVRLGMVGAVRVLMMAEEHGAGRQLVRYRSWPVCWGPTLSLGALCIVASAAAGLTRAWSAAAILGLAGLALALRLVLEWSGGTGAVCTAFRRLQHDEDRSASRMAQPATAAWQPVERKEADRRQLDHHDEADVVPHREPIAVRDRPRS